MTGIVIEAWYDTKILLKFHSYSINRNLSFRRLLYSNSVSRLDLTFDESDLTIERKTSISSSSLLGYYD